MAQNRAPIQESEPHEIPGRTYQHITPLSAFGLFAVTAMLVTYALESKRAWFILAFAFACALGSIYRSSQGSWPFGLVEGVWSGVAVRRWWVKRE
jgi:4-amino-4-deoxy-L-arabinose transferase-like glycosyltransferase